MASSVPPKKNAAFTTYVMLASQSQANTFQDNPTLASGDVKVCVDDGAPANLATLPTVDGDFTKRVKVELSASEMNGDVITVLFSDASGAEWKDLMFTIHTAAQTLDEVDSNVDAILADTNELQTDDIPGLIDALPTAAENRAEIDANSTQLAAIVADTNELQTDWTNGGRLDLLIDAIKAVTDNIPNSGALTDVIADVSAILADTSTDGVSLSTATQQAIADEMLKRGVSNVEDTAGALTLAELILAAFESSRSGTTWTIRKSDATTFSTRTLTLDDTADPITGVT